MIGDAKFRMPPIDGDLADPGQMMDYLGSLGNALDSAFRAIAEKMNNPQQIIVPSSSGMRSLSDAMDQVQWKSGDIKASIGRRDNVLRQDGWVPLNGRNGTPDSYDAFIVGSAEATNAGVGVDGGDDTGVPVPSGTGGPVPTDTQVENEAPISVIAAFDGCVDVENGADTTAAPAAHTHPMSSHAHDMSSHVHEVNGSLKTFSVIWMMKL